MQKTSLAMRMLLAVVMCMMCLVCNAPAQESAPVLPDIAAFAEGRLTQTDAFSDEKTQMMYFTGNWQDVKYTVMGYFDLIKSSYHLTEDAHFELDYSHNGEEYDYHVYCFSYNGPEGDTVANMHTGTTSWEISGSDVVICYSQGRPEVENVHFGFSQGFALADTGERLDVEKVIAAQNTRPLPDIEAYTGGRLTRSAAEYWKGGDNRMIYIGASEDVKQVMDSYIALLANNYALEQTHRFEWAHGHEHICCAFWYTGEGAENLKTTNRLDETIGMNIEKAHVLVSYQQGSDGVDFLMLEFHEKDFSVKDTGERL